MAKKLSIETILERIRKKHNGTVEIVDLNEVKNIQSMVKFRCTVCGNVWTTQLQSVMNGHGCRKCYDKRNAVSKLIPLDEINKRIKESGANAEIIGEYKDTKHKALAKCLKCGYEWFTKPRDLLNGHGCPKCKDVWKGRRKTKEEFIEEMNILYHNEYKYLIDKDYVVVRDYITFICPKGHVVTQQVSVHMHGMGCKLCRESSLERKIRCFLEDEKIPFKQEFNDFEWLKTTKFGRLSFDFLLTEYDIAIECQGIQHFESVKLFGGQKALEETITRDKRKKSLSKEHGITLVYFLEKKYEKYMMKDDIFFTNKNDLLDFINSNIKRKEENESKEN